MNNSKDKATEDEWVLVDKDETKWVENAQAVFELEHLRVTDVVELEEDRHSVEAEMRLSRRSIIS